MIKNDEALIMDAVSQPLEILDFDHHFRRRECHRLSEAIVNEINHDDIVCITWNFFVMIGPFMILIALCIIIMATAIIYRKVHCRERI
ncbi:unnamed protein product [Onchocerca flexuosa]|uniref:Uncharacterized protein n=1 Tax=Onchocerca flexuosa TaxID=387005 RepID=A0A183HN44_9BILA|nr:unnamed protein product [Onchocerca flexuosa]